MRELKGFIFNIQRFCITDGPGIRTTVFLKGCPLNCLWCHNPESKAGYPEIAYYCEKYVGCNNTLEVIGKEVTVREVTDEVLKDKIFYENSCGGITLSGGEPLAQFPFALALLQEAKAVGIHTCLDTCGYAPTESFTEMLNAVDLFLYDYKETDPQRHKEYTGFVNELILKNLRHIDRLGGKIILRVPIIPGYNDRADHFDGITKTANQLKNLIEINVMPYHPLGKSKCEAIGRKYPLEDLSFPQDKIVESWINRIQSGTDIVVTKG